MTKVDIFSEYCLEKAVHLAPDSTDYFFVLERNEYEKRKGSALIALLDNFWPKMVVVKRKQPRCSD